MTIQQNSLKGACWPHPIQDFLRCSNHLKILAKLFWTRDLGRHNKKLKYNNNNKQIYQYYTKNEQKLEQKYFLICNVPMMAAIVSNNIVVESCVKGGSIELFLPIFTAWPLRSTSGADISETNKYFNFGLKQNCSMHYHELFQ